MFGSRDGASEPVARASRRIAHAPAHRVGDVRPVHRSAASHVAVTHRVVHAARRHPAHVAVVVLYLPALVSLGVDARVHLGVRRHGKQLHGGGGREGRAEERGDEEEDGAGHDGCECCRGSDTRREYRGGKCSV